jgi:glycosyltransferase involved in cell wall biosynthesis
MRAGPEVTVIIPTRNRRAMLSRSLQCALGQQDVELEVVVVDEASSDGTAEELGQVDDPRLRVVRRNHAGGLASARNAGVRAAKGDWLAFLDDDDLWSPRKLRTQLDEASATGADFVYTSAVLLTQSVAAIEVRRARSPAEVTRHVAYYDPLEAGGSSVMARCELVRRLGGFDERLVQLTSWDMWRRLDAAGKGAVCYEPLVGYVHHPGSMLRVDRRDVVKELAYFDAKHGLSKAEARHPDRIWFWRWAGEAAVRGGRRIRGARLFLRAALRYRSELDLRLALGTLVRGERALSPDRDRPPTALEGELDWLRLYR